MNFFCAPFSSIIFMVLSIILLNAPFHPAWIAAIIDRLDSYKNGGNIYTNTELNISKAVKLLKNNDIKVLILIRELLYIVISNNLDYNDIINKLRYFINKEINNKYLAKINNLIYEMERKMQISVRQFYYIEHIIIGAYYIIHNKEKN